MPWVHEQLPYLCIATVDPVGRNEKLLQAIVAFLLRQYNDHHPDQIERGISLVFSLGLLLVC